MWVAEPGFEPGQPGSENLCFRPRVLNLLIVTQDPAPHFHQRQLPCSHLFREYSLSFDQPVLLELIPWPACSLLTLSLSLSPLLTLQTDPLRQKLLSYGPIILLCPLIPVTLNPTGPTYECLAPRASDTLLLAMRLRLTEGRGF